MPFAYKLENIMNYRIADLNILLDVEGRTAKNAEKYIIDGDFKPDIVIRSSYERAKLAYPRFAKYNFEENYKREGLNYMFERDEFAKEILKFDGLVLHASAVAIANGGAYLFSAPSGTGKSTHTKLWLEKFGDSAYILNDDKPAIRILDDGIYAYGTPWCGSSNISVNAKVKLQGICFIKRDDHDWINPMNAKEAAIRILHGISIPLKLTEIEVMKQLETINTLIERIPIYEMGCTPNISSADMAYDVMSKPIVG